MKKIINKTELQTQGKKISIYIYIFPLQNKVHFAFFLNNKKLILFFKYFYLSISILNLNLKLSMSFDHSK